MAEIRLPGQQSPNIRGVDVVYYTSGTAIALAVGSFTPSGDQYLVDPGQVLLVKTGATLTALTVQTPIMPDGLTLSDLDVMVPANSDRLILIGSERIYGKPAKFVLSAVANVSIAVLNRWG